MEIKSFGGVKVDSRLVAPTSCEAVTKLITSGSVLAIGNSKSYGDVGLLSNGLTISSKYLNRFIAFDEEVGIVECEPGVTLREIQAIFVKRGWMLAVTPGTSFVTVAGAIANDVHGKDHHYAGTFGDHVLELTLARSDGSVLVCSRTQNTGLFRATIGGLGLTGFILSAKLQLKAVAGPYFDSESIPYNNISEFFQLSLETESQGWQATVSWFDCSTSKFGRGSFTRGNPSSRKYDPASDDSRLDLQRTGLNFPVQLPFSLVGKTSLDLFNIGYFQLQKATAGRKEIHYQDFYYPLDGVTNWNRIYGPKGFFQYQSVVPPRDAEAVTKAMLSVIKRSGQGSFLGVLKTFAERESAGMLSFARAGATLALDFPNRGEKTEQLFKELDRIVLEAGGTLNPSKDFRMTREMFSSGFPSHKEFSKYRDPAFCSDFAKRVMD